MVAGIAWAITLSTGLWAQTPTPLQKQNQLNVLTYNVHNGIGLDGRTDYVRIGELIRNSGADVVAIQEVDSATVTFMTKRLVIEAQEEKMDAVVQEAGRIIKKLEPKVEVKPR